MPCIPTSSLCLARYQSQSSSQLWKEGWKGGVGEGSHGRTGELQEQEKDKEDAGNLALWCSLCAASLRWGWEWCDLDSDDSGTSFLSHA